MRSAQGLLRKERQGTQYEKHYGKNRICGYSAGTDDCGPVRQGDQCISKRGNGIAD